MLQTPGAMSRYALELEAFNVLTRLLRLRAGLSQVQAIEKSSSYATDSSLRNWESSRSRPNLDKWWPFLRELGFEPQEIFDAWHDALAQVKAETQRKEDATLLEVLRQKLDDDPSVRRELRDLIDRIGNPEVRAELERLAADDQSEDEEVGA